MPTTRRHDADGGRRTALLRDLRTESPIIISNFHGISVLKLAGLLLALVLPACTVDAGIVGGGGIPSDAGPYCLQSCADNGYYTNVSARVSNGEPVYTKCSAASRTKCTLYINGGCSTLAPGEAPAVDDVFYYCESATQSAFCAASWAYFKSRTVPVCESVPRVWTCVRSCADNGNYLLAQRVANTVRCMGAAEGACSFFSDSACSVVAPNSVAVDGSGARGTTCASPDQTSWCRAAYDSLINGISSSYCALSTTVAPFLTTVAPILTPVPTTTAVNSCLGKTVCGESCVDLFTDAKNCGACLNTCPLTSPGCVQGICQSISTATATTESSSSSSSSSSATSTTYIAQNKSLETDRSTQSAEVTPTSGGVSVGAIAGGVVAGVLGIAALAGGLLIYHRKKATIPESSAAAPAKPWSPPPLEFYSPQYPPQASPSASAWTPINAPCVATNGYYPTKPDQLPVAPGGEKNMTHPIIPSLTLSLTKSNCLPSLPKTASPRFVRWTERRGWFPSPCSVLRLRL